MTRTLFRQRGFLSDSCRVLFVYTPPPPPCPPLLVCRDTREFGNIVNLKVDSDDLSSSRVRTTKTISFSLSPPYRFPIVVRLFGNHPSVLSRFLRSPRFFCRSVESYTTRIIIIGKKIKRSRRCFWREGGGGGVSLRRAGVNEREPKSRSSSSVAADQLKTAPRPLIMRARPPA